jgi:hypothetical protein
LIGVAEKMKISTALLEESTMVLVLQSMLIGIVGMIGL